VSAAVHPFPGTIAEALEWARGNARTGVVIVAADEDGAWEATWSQMQLRDLVYAHRLLGIAIDRRVSGEVPAR
jgi:hypothetical protein